MCFIRKSRQTKNMVAQTYHGLLSRHFSCCFYFTLFILLVMLAAHVWKCSLLVVEDLTSTGASMRRKTLPCTYIGRSNCRGLTSLHGRDRNKEKFLHVRRTCDHVRLTCPPIFSHVQKIMHRSTQNYKFCKTGTILNYFKIQQIVGRCCFM